MEDELTKEMLLTDLRYLADGTKTEEELDALAEKLLRSYNTRTSAEKQKEK